MANGYQPSLLVEALKRGLKCVPKPMLTPRQSEVIGRIIACGSGKLGAHLYSCESCGHAQIVPLSCRDRHCPRCQRHKAEEWLERQKQSLLPIPYFHLVFTLPHDLNALIRQNKKACLDLLFSAACSTLMDFGKNNLGAQLGLTAVLHTWGQRLNEHYHLHIIVTGGGLSEAGDEWIEAEQGKAAERWLFSTRALSKVYKARYLEGLEKLYHSKKLEFHGKISHWAEPLFFKTQLRSMAKKKWHVFAKAPFAGPEQVLEYLAIYTHRVAISQKRIKKVDTTNDSVTLSYKDYTDNSKWKKMEISCEEFTHRFAQHILPSGFCKIRHYGIVSNSNRSDKIELCKLYLIAESEEPTLTGHEDTSAMLGAAIASQRDVGRDDDHPGAQTCGCCERCGSDRLRWVTVFTQPVDTECFNGNLLEPKLSITRGPPPKVT